jgi:protein-L-isoaspartate(D-aspartate) O-methyltransferase
MSDDPVFVHARQRMVEQQLRVPWRGIRDPRVLAAMAKVPRHEFVPAELRAEAYEDHPLPIGFGQTISQPFIVAFMTEQLALQPTARVLEIGTGCGYQTAVLAELAAEVFSIEIVAPLARRATADLRRLGYDNICVRAGDGHGGWPEAAPFDAVIVTCAAEHAPAALMEQLQDGGRMIIPLGSATSQTLHRITRHGRDLERRRVLAVRFVPMTGVSSDVVTRD